MKRTILTCLTLLVIMMLSIISFTEEKMNFTAKVKFDKISVNIADLEGNADSLAEAIRSHLSGAGYVEFVDTNASANVILSGFLTKADKTFTLNFYAEDLVYSRYHGTIKLSWKSEEVPESTIKKVNQVTYNVSKAIFTRYNNEKKREKSLFKSFEKSSIEVFISGGKFKMGSDIKILPSKNENGSKVPGQEELEDVSGPEEEASPAEDELDETPKAETNKTAPAENNNSETAAPEEATPTETAPAETKDDEISKLAKNFDMVVGELDEYPRTEVSVEDFYMDRYEVTNFQFKKFIDANPQWRKGMADRKLVDKNYLFDWNGSEYPVGKGAYPVRYVSWYAAKAYADWMKRRLPTEAEWEYAAGGPQHFRYSLGNIVDLTRPSEYSFDLQKPEMVGSYRANEFGLSDMSGSVAEWCSSLYMSYPYVATDGREEQKNVNKRRICRGGSFDRYDRSSIRCANRMASYPDKCRHKIGFRTVRSAKVETKVEEKKTAPEKKEKDNTK